MSNLNPKSAIQLATLLSQCPVSHWPVVKFCGYGQTNCCMTRLQASIEAKCPLLKLVATKTVAEYVTRYFKMLESFNAHISGLIEATKLPTKPSSVKVTNFFLKDDLVEVDRFDPFGVLVSLNIE